MKHPVRRRLEQCGVACAARLIHPLTRLPLRHMWVIADAWARIIELATPRRRKLADANLAQAFPELTRQERRQIIRRSIRCMSRTMLELFMLPRLTKQDLESLVETPDLTPLREAARAGPGVILITAHYGNWELLGAHLAHQVAPLAVVARDHRHSGLADMINDARASHGVRVLARESTREMLRVLGSGGMLGMLPDQHAAEGGIRAEFLGRPAWVFTGPAVLAARTGARVFAGFCVRDAGTPFRLELLPELALVATGDREADAVTNTRLITEAIEQAIRAHPDNWLWLHNRWKDRRLAAADD